VQALLRAYATIKREISHTLVIVGPKIYGGKTELSKLIKNLNLEDDVIFTGYVADEDLPAFYNGASIFVFPSLYEGFGLPPLEAMACGTPVITSNRASLPEAVGDAGIMVDPDDIEGLAKAMVKLTTDEELRQTMIKRGLERVKLFSPEKAAAATIEVYREVLDID
jgi:glycosyltransferase involved in cell wall biosynthesis